MWAREGVQGLVGGISTPLKAVGVEGSPMVWKWRVRACSGAVHARDAEGNEWLLAYEYG